MNVKQSSLKGTLHGCRDGSIKELTNQPTNQPHSPPVGRYLMWLHAVCVHKAQSLGFRPNQQRNEAWLTLITACVSLATVRVWREETGTWGSPTVTDRRAQ